MKPQQKYPIVIDHHFLIGPYIEAGDDMLFFGPSQPGRLHFLGPNATIWDLLVLSECFPSKADAKRNWKGTPEIPQGYWEIGPIGKSKIMLFGLKGGLFSPSPV